MTTPPDAAAAPAQPLSLARRLRPWLVLLALQSLVASLILGPFILGRIHFAYVDVASDTYSQFTASAMELARLFGKEGWSGWSFRIGLGAPVAFLFSDPLRLLSALAGPEMVLPLRIWVYLLKLAAGGAFFLLLARQIVERKEAALVAALAYTFCGYMVTNGVWDPEANPFVFFPLVAWALLRQVRRGGVLALPLTVAATLLAGVFFVSVAVSIAVACAAAVALATDRRQMARVCLTRLLPLTLGGFALAAPNVVPATLQLLDSPRVGVPGETWSNALEAIFQLTEPGLLLQQLAGLFHKDLLGSANMYAGYMNYLEGPGFYVAFALLLLLPQLWAAGGQDRRALVVGLAAIAVYMAWPAPRLAAFGFAAPYFRVTLLWPTLALLLLGARALDRFLERPHGPALLAGVVLVAGLFAALTGLLWNAVLPSHAAKVGLLLAIWGLLLGAIALGRLPLPRAALFIVPLVLAEALAMAWPSYLGRPSPGPEFDFYSDGTREALDAVRRADPGVYRIEKKHMTVSQADSMAQGYMGVRSYYYHGRAVVDLHRAMGMLGDFGKDPPVNATNWLEGPGDRAVLHSLLGVRYVISKSPIDWLGFELAHRGRGWFAWRNPHALPLGVVHSRQVTQDEMLLPEVPEPRRSRLRELAMINAAVLEHPMPEWGTKWDLAGRAARPGLDLQADYVAPAAAHQRHGLQVDVFRDDFIQGRIDAPDRGLLVLSIPDYRGWSVEVDGRPAPLLRASYGLLATPVTAGPHRIELTYRLPGLRLGLILAALAALVLGALQFSRRRSTGAGPAG